MNHRFRIGNCIRDRYTITDILLPEGGFGIIYKVREYTHPQQPFRVMKQLKKPTAVNLRITHLAPEEQERILNDYWESYVQQFEREAQALAKLSETCTQIPKIIEQFNERVNEQDEHLFVQEFIDGYSLDQEIRLNGRRSERETKDLLIEILEILEHIQTEHVVVHGDIKPENIIRSTDTTRDKKLVLIDFGLVKEVIIPDEGVIIPQLVLGTEGYVAPEIINQEVYQVSFVSDIYAVGMIGLFAITGEDPSTYEGELAKNWQNIATVSPKFTTFLQKMVCPNYRERYQNASEALAELRKLDQPVPPLPTIKLILIIIITAGVGLLGFIVFPYLTHDDRKLTKTYTNPEANMKFTIKYPDGWVEKPIESENEEKLKLSPKNISEKDDCPLELSVNINDLTTRRPLPSLLEYAKNTAFKKIHDDPANTGIELSDKAELNHEDAYQITHQRKENNQCVLKVLERGTLFHEKAYYIIYKSPKQEFDKYEPTVEKIMESFEIN